jgi:hypothetical protein
VGTAAAVALAVVSCITVAPDLPTLPPTRPTIDHQAVRPAAGTLLVWPDEFFVPVEIVTPGETFKYSVYLDGIHVQDADNQMATDNGEKTNPLQVMMPSSTTCPHELVFTVAYQWADVAHQAPDSVGGDVVRWYFYNGGPGGPMGCPALDAGSGSLPEAGSDALARGPVDAGAAQ